MTKRVRVNDLQKKPRDEFPEETKKKKKTKKLKTFDRMTYSNNSA
jgi:hypothetical protein